MLEALFEASASVIAILFSIWGFIQVIREQRTYIPKRAERFAFASFLLLVLVCLASLWLMVLQGTEWSIPPTPLFLATTFLSALFSLAIVLMSASFVDLIKRV